MIVIMIRYTSDGIARTDVLLMIGRGVLRESTASASRGSDRKTVTRC